MMVRFPSNPSIVPNRGDCNLLDMLYNPRHVPTTIKAVVIQPRVVAWHHYHMYDGKAYVVCRLMAVKPITSV